MSTSLLVSSLFMSLFILSPFLAQAIVPASDTFKYVNEGEFGEYTVEYLAYYRVTPIQSFPFALCFYNSTPDSFILGIRMGHRRSESIMRWVWDANRARPVHENATLTFGPDGNLVLAEADGTVAWQTGTANKGVVGLELLNGNLILYDNKRRPVWQSFEHPTDTILVGQALRAKGPNKIVSRASISDPSDGPYSYGMEKGHLAMYFKPKNAQKALLYYKSDEFGDGKGALANLEMYCQPEYGEPYAFEVGFTYNMTGSPSSGSYLLTRPKYNSTYSMLRVDIDGNLRVYTYDENVDWGSWGTTFELFGRDPNENNENECNMPRRCGVLGVCEDSQCVACPKPNGLLGWSKACAPPASPPCKGGAGVDYYKVEGVEHYTSLYAEGKGPMKFVDCRDRCSKDCGCLGFFYREESSKCLLVPDLGTLVKVENPSHVGYIKMSK